MGDVMQNNPITEFLQNLDPIDSDKQLYYFAKRSLFDLIGTAVAGSESPAAKIMLHHTQRHYPASPYLQGAASLLSTELFSPGGAVLLGATTIDSLDCHDGQKLTKGHVGCALLPALVAVLESSKQNPSGEDFLKLLIAGYEVGTRAGIAQHATCCDYHTSGAWGAVNCAAISAHILGLNEEQTQHAIGIAEYNAPRSQMMRNIDYPTMVKDGAGWGAMVGVDAAYQAQAGFTGAPALTVVSDEVADIWQDLGQHWYMKEQYIKPYPVCRWAQPAIAAALSISQEHTLNLADIRNVEVTTFHEGTRLFSGIPENSEQAQYGISFPVAVALMTGTVGAQDVYSGFEKPEFQAMTRKIDLQEHEPYNQLFPAERWAHVKVHMNDGNVLESAPMEATGDPHIPLTDAVMHEKFFNLCEPVWGTEKTAKVLDCVLNLEDYDLQHLLTLMRN